MFEGTLIAEPGWYANFQSADVAFVVFRGKVFRYPRGDPDGRASAQAHGRALGVPEPTRLDRLTGASQARGGLSFGGVAISGCGPGTARPAARTTA
jgi:hypothetical protein